MKPRVSDIVRDLVAEGRFKEALSLARSFRLGISKDDQVQMARAYECMVFPRFYESIGKNVSEEIRNGIGILVRLYGRCETA